MKSRHFYARACFPGLEVWYPGLAWDQSLGFVEEDLDTTNTGLGPTACYVFPCASFWDVAAALMQQSETCKPWTAALDGRFLAFDDTKTATERAWISAVPRLRNCLHWDLRH